MRHRLFLAIFYSFSTLTSSASITPDILGHGYLGLCMYACIQTTSKVDGRVEGVNTWRRQPDVGVDRGEVLERAFHRDPLRLPLGPLSSCLTLSLLFAVSSSASLPLEIMKHVIKCLALFNHSNLVSHDIRFYLFTAEFLFEIYIFF